jgi:hypothetical protein
MPNHHHSQLLHRLDFAIVEFLQPVHRRKVDLDKCERVGVRALAECSDRDRQRKPRLAQSLVELPSTAVHTTVCRIPRPIYHRWFKRSQVSPQPTTDPTPQPNLDTTSGGESTLSSDITHTHTLSLSLSLCLSYACLLFSSLKRRSETGREALPRLPSPLRRVRDTVHAPTEVTQSGPKPLPFWR